MPDATPPKPARATSLHPALFALSVLVTLVAGLLVAQVQVRSLEWRSEFPQLSLEDPARALFVIAERDRRIVQSGTLPKWWFDDRCTACSPNALRARWDELFEERARYRGQGYRKQAGKQWLREAQAARTVSLAGWGDAHDVELLRSQGIGEFPSYLLQRSSEIIQGDANFEQARARHAAAFVSVGLGLSLALVLCAVYVAVAWKRGARWPRRAPLAAPAIGRGLLIFVWALGFRSVCSALRWNDPHGPFQIFALLPSLSLTLGISALLIGTRMQPADMPIRALLRCPRRGRLWWATGTLGLAATGCLIGFDFVLWHASGYLHLQSNWPDAVRERFLYGSPIEAALSRLSAVVLAPFAEELAYRGVVFGTLATRTNAHRAAPISLP